MKKVFIGAICLSLLMSSCYNASNGALTGANFGAMIGSAIGGITGGPRGHDVGMLIGMATGAAGGAAIGAANEESRKEEVRDHYRQITARTTATDPAAESGFDATGSGDDRLYDFQGSDYTGDYSASNPVTVMPAESQISASSLGHLTYSDAINIENARFVDSNGDGVLSAGEDAKIIFELRNVSGKTLTDITPCVVETTGNSRIKVSQSIHVESLEAGKALRYTAIVLAGKSLKAGTARFALSVLNNGTAISKVTQFDIQTAK